MNNPSSKSVAVLGAGITGLTAAFRLRQRGFTVTIFEKTGRAGGVVQSGSADGFLWECGPNSFQEDDARQTGLIAELGLDSEKITVSAAAKNRYIVRGGRPVATPLSPFALPGSPLFSTRAKFRLLGDLFLRPRTRASDVSIAAFVRDHFGREFVDYALNPFVAGVYAGDPEKLSARHAFTKLLELEQNHGSIIRGQLASARRRRAAPGGPPPKPKLVSFRRGLQALTDALAARLGSSLVTGASVESLLPGRPWQILWNHGGTTTRSEFDAVVLALPAGGLARLPIGAAGESPLASLAEIEHPPLASLFLGFRREQVAHPLDGFGVLVPEVERRQILGALFSSTLFPGRAPDGHVALTVFAGGSRQPALARLAPSELLPIVLADLRGLLGVSGEPVFQRHAMWPQAIPQYNLGYGRFLETMAQTEGKNPGLQIGGQARDGSGLGQCLLSGLRLAGAAEQFLNG